MKLSQRFKHMVKAIDFFYSTEMLRYQDDLQYKTLTGGLISLAIIVTIVAGFANMILNTLDLNTFTISTQIFKNAVPPPSTLEITEDSSFRMAIQIWGHNLSDTKRYFDVTFTLRVDNYGTRVNNTGMPLETCTKNYFKKYPEIVDNFERLHSGYWLCPTLNTTLSLEGKYSSETYTQYSVDISACKNTSDPRPCASPQEIQDYFIQNGNFFYFTIYFTNTQINPDKKDYLQMYIEDESYTIFGNSIGSQSYLYFSDYSVQTDESIWPFTKTQAVSGCLAENLAVNHPYQTNINSTYATFSIAKSSDSIVYTRQVQKLSAVFSFMGGMIGAVSAVLFIIKIYTSLSFQFSIAFQIFKKKRDEPQLLDETHSEKIVRLKKEQEDHLTMNLLNFVRYYIYKFCEKIGCVFDWPEMNYANECKEEILRQLDIKLLLKRIIFIEHCLTYIIDDYQLDALQMKKPQTPKEIRQIRLKCESIVDRQLQLSDQDIPGIIDESKIRPELIEPMEPLSPQTSSNMISRQFIGLKEKSPGEKAHRPEKTVVFQKKVSHFQMDYMDKDVVIMDMQSVAQGKDDDESSKHTGRGNKVGNSYRREMSRKFYLMQLQANAEQGNSISNKIWSKLDERVKKSVKNLGKSNFKND